MSPLQVNGRTHLLVMSDHMLRKTSLPDFDGEDLLRFTPDTGYFPSDGTLTMGTDKVITSSSQHFTNMAAQGDLLVFSTGDGAVTGLKRVDKTQESFGYDVLYRAEEKFTYTTRLELSTQALVCGQWNGSVYIRNPLTGDILSKMTGHHNPIYSLNMRCGAHANEVVSTFISGSSDRTAKVWDLSTGHCTDTLRGHTRTINHIRRTDHHFVCHGIVATCGKDGVRLWDTKLPGSYNCVASLFHGKDIATCLEILGWKLLTAGTDGNIVLWDVRNQANPIAVVNTRRSTMAPQTTTASSIDEDDEFEHTFDWKPPCLWRITAEDKFHSMVAIDDSVVVTGGEGELCAWKF